MVIGVFLTLFCFFIFFKIDYFNKCGINPPFLCLLFLQKIVIGVLLLYIYTFFYPNRESADVFKYLDDSKIIWNETKNNFSVFFKILFGLDQNNIEVTKILSKINHWYLSGNSNIVNDSRLVIRFNLLLITFSNGNQYVHLIILGLWSFSGQIALFKFIKKILASNVIALISVFFIPSFVFWSSGVLKEGILVGFLGHFFWNIYLIYSKLVNYKTIGLTITCFCGIFFSKFYVAFCLIPFLAYIFFESILDKTNPKKKLLVYVILTIAIGSLGRTKLKEALITLSQKQQQFINVSKGGYFIEKNGDTLRIEYEIGEKQIIVFNDSCFSKRNIIAHRFVNISDNQLIEIKGGKKNKYRILKMIKGADSKIELSKLKTNNFRFIFNTPEYFFNVLFRPLPNEVNNVFIFLCLIENFILIICISLSLVFFKKPSQMELIWILGISFFMIPLIFVIGATTPIVGAIVRYKIPFLPFLFSIPLRMTNFKKLMGFLNRLKQI